MVIIPVVPRPTVKYNMDHSISINFNLTSKGWTKGKLLKFLWLILAQTGEKEKCRKHKSKSQKPNLKTLRFFVLPFELNTPWVFPGKYYKNVRHSALFGPIAKRPPSGLHLVVIYELLRLQHIGNNMPKPFRADRRLNPTTVATNVTENLVNFPAEPHHFQCLICILTFSGGNVYKLLTFIWYMIN